MKFEYAVEEYTTYLLKLSFLYVKDRQVAEDIVQDVFEKLYEKHGAELPFIYAKGYFVQSVVNKCRDYFRSWQYRKVQVVDIFHQQEQAPIPEFAEPELVNYVLSLPMKYREIVILYYFDEQGTTEIAEFLNIPVGTVKSRLQKARQLLKGILLEEGADTMRNKLHDSLGNWEKEGTELKSRIYEKTVNDPKKRKRAIWKPILTVAATAALLLGGAGIFTKLQGDVAQVAPTELQEQNEPAFRIHDERTLRITEYMMYHRGTKFYTKEEVEYQSLMDVISIYTLFNELEKYDYYWDEERRSYYYKREIKALEIEMRNPEFKAFYEQMFAELSITKEDLVELYLLPNIEAEMLVQEISNKNIGLNEEGYISSKETREEYQALIGISNKDLEQLKEKIPKRQEIVNPETVIPYSASAFAYPSDVIKNEGGELIFPNPPDLRGVLEIEYITILYELRRVMPVKADLSRFSFHLYKAALENYENIDIEKNKIAKDLAEILIIFERSIDWDAEF